MRTAVAGLASPARCRGCFGSRLLRGRELRHCGFGGIDAGSVDGNTLLATEGGNGPQLPPRELSGEGGGAVAETTGIVVCVVGLQGVAASDPE